MSNSFQQTKSSLNLCGNCLSMVTPLRYIKILEGGSAFEWQVVNNYVVVATRANLLRTSN